jgi:pyruvate/2-oxoglutarate dehydrogenase complex dihydrolipoamide dehydrogenase (E3) component
MTHRPDVPPPDEYNAELLSNVHPADWHNPTPPSRYNLVVIGAGTAGIVAATGAGVLGARVAIIERSLLGGDCLNWGCVPSKSLIRCARAAHEVREAGRFGVTVESHHVDFAAAMQYVRQQRATVSYHDSVTHFQKYHVDLFFGDAQFAGPNHLNVNGETLRFKKAIIASGSRAFIPPIEGLQEAGFLTNETVFSLTERPARLAIIGGGPVGCELAQSFQRLGSEVILFNQSPHLLPREDSDVADIVQQVFLREGITLLLHTTVTQVTTHQGKKTLRYERHNETSEITVDEILVATGRTPNIETLNLDAARVAYDQRSGVHINDYMQTSNSDIYAAGDVCLQRKFTHSADASARIALQNALFMGRERLSALTIPWCTFTDPEVAHVGIHEEEAIRRDMDINTFSIDMKDLDRAITEGIKDGLIKIHVKGGSDQIVGATIVGHNAGELISHISMAIASNIGLKKIANVVYPYPVLTEAIHKIADSYNMTRLTSPVKGLSSMWLDLTG